MIQIIKASRQYKKYKDLFISLLRLHRHRSLHVDDEAINPCHESSDKKVLKYCITIVVIESTNNILGE